MYLYLIRDEWLWHNFVFFFSVKPEGENKRQKERRDSLRTAQHKGPRPWTRVEPLRAA